MVVNHVKYSNLSTEELDDAISQHIKKIKYKSYKDSVNQFKLEYQTIYKKHKSLPNFNLKFSDMKLKDFEIFLYLVDDFIITENYGNWKNNILDILKIPLNQRIADPFFKEKPKLEYTHNNSSENRSCYDSSNQALDIPENPKSNFIQEFVDEFQNKHKNKKMMPLYDYTNTINTSITDSKTFEKEKSIPLLELENPQFYELSSNL